jgi:hypothetical protein
MKINLADSTKEPSLKNLRQIMLEVASDAKEEQKKVEIILKKAIQAQMAKILKEYSIEK